MQPPNDYKAFVIVNNRRGTEEEIQEGHHLWPCYREQWEMMNKPEVVYISATDPARLESVKWEMSDWMKAAGLLRSEKQYSLIRKSGEHGEVYTVKIGNREGGEVAKFDLKRGEVETEDESAVKIILLFCKHLLANKDVEESEVVQYWKYGIVSKEALEEPDDAEVSLIGLKRP